MHVKYEFEQRLQMRWNHLPGLQFQHLKTIVRLPVSASSSETSASAQETEGLHAANTCSGCNDDSSSSGGGGGGHVKDDDLIQSSTMAQARTTKGTGAHP